jgi:hypothetical protein
MGKRSEFERVPRDFYPSPREAVEPLVPHLAGETDYVEPCAGDGALIGWLNVLTDMRCEYASDIEPMADGIHRLDVFNAMWGAELHITNPPWDRKILHPLIEKLTNRGGRAWLLFDADWCHTKQAIPYLPRLRKIVSVGRVKWIPDSKMTGKDNCCWYYFTKPSDEPTIFYGRQ